MKIEHEMQVLCPPSMNKEAATERVIEHLLEQCPDAYLTAGAPTFTETPEMLIATLRFTSVMFDHAYAMALETFIDEIEHFRDVILAEEGMPLTQKEEYVTVLFALLDRIITKYQQGDK